MTALRFVLRGAPEQRLDLSPLTPERLAGLGIAEIEALALHTTRRRVVVGDVFRVVAGDTAAIVIEGGSTRFDRVGAAMRHGSLRVEGDVGQQAGRALKGGRLSIGGSTGGWAGSGLSGGMIEIDGDAGDCLGGPLEGELTGMRGGVVVVHGNAGLRAADRLRRGLIIVEGNAGPRAGSGMIAGTLVVCGKSGALPGILMRRGTLVLGGTDQLAPGFVAAVATRLVFTTLLANAVAPLSQAASRIVISAHQRYLGDLAALGQGEIFLEP